MASTYLTPTMVTRKALAVLHQKLSFVGSINRSYDDSFARDGAKIGDSLKIRLPNRYTLRRGKTLDAQDVAETSVTLQVATQAGVDMNFTSADLTLNIDDFSTRFIEPAMAIVASGMESDALGMALDVHQQVNNQGSAATFNKFLQGRKQMVDALAPANDRMVQLTTQDNVDMVDSLKGLFNDQTSIAKQYRDGYLGKTAGFDFTENTLIPTITPGTRASYQLNGVPASGATSVTVGTGTGSIALGEVFTIAGVNRVHPETKVSTGVLQQFVTTAAYSGTTTTIAFSPSLTTTGARQNVSALPATNAAVTFAGTASTTHGISLAYQKDAFAFATADLVMPKGVDMAAREVYDGISMRLVRAYDINNDNMPCRLDVLYGFKTLRAQLASRIANN